MKTMKRSWAGRLAGRAPAWAALLALAALAALAGGSAWAWGPQGHRTVGASPGAAGLRGAKSSARSMANGNTTRNTSDQINKM